MAGHNISQLLTCVGPVLPTLYH